MFGWFSKKKADEKSVPTSAGESSTTIPTIPTESSTSSLTGTAPSTPNAANTVTSPTADKAEPPLGRGSQRRLTAAGSTSAFAHMPTATTQPFLPTAGGASFPTSISEVPSAVVAASTSADAPQAPKKGFSYKRKGPAARPSSGTSASMPVPSNRQPSLPSVMEDHDGDDILRGSDARADDAKSITSIGMQSLVTRITASNARQQSSSSMSQPEVSSRVCELMTHSHDFSVEELVLNADVFPGWCVGDFVVIRPVVEMNRSDTIVRGTSQSKHFDDTADGSKGGSEDEFDRKKALLLQITSLQNGKGGSLQASMSVTMAELAHFKAKQVVELRRLGGREEAEALFGLEHVEFSFKDQYCSRSGMWRFRKSLARQCLHVGKAVTGYGLRMQVKEISARCTGKSNQPVLSGIVTPTTTFTFRSRSSHIMLLVQMSREMWQFDNDGELHFEKLVNRFLSTLFARWAAIGATHAVTVVLFTRSFYDMDMDQLLTLSGLKDQLKEVSNVTNAEEILSANPLISQFLQDHAICVDSCGRLYEDFYYTVAEDLVVTPSLSSAATASTGTAGSSVPAGPGMTEWHRIIRALKRAFSAFPVMANWGLRAVPEGSDRRINICSTPSLAAQGNFLETINLCLNVFEKHQQDRDLYRMGQNIIALTAGSGVYEVDAALSQITKQRMMDNGIGCDVVSMARPPMHNVPLFITKHRNLADPAFVVRSTSKLPAPPISIQYTQPHWIHCSFFGHVSAAFNAIAAPTQSKASKGHHQHSNPAAAALIATGVALGSLPQVISDVNPFFSQWDSALARYTRQPLCWTVDRVLSRGTSYSWSEPKLTGDVIAEGEEIHHVVETQENEFQPQPMASVFSMYQPRLTLAGPRFPTSMLEILRKAGRAPRLVEMHTEFTDGKEASDQPDKTHHSAQQSASSALLSPIGEHPRASTLSGDASPAADQKEMNTDTIKSISSTGARSRKGLRAVFAPEEEKPSHHHHHHHGRSSSIDQAQSRSHARSNSGRFGSRRSNSMRELAGNAVVSSRSKWRPSTSLWGLQQGVGYSMSPLQRGENDFTAAARRHSETFASDISSMVSRSLREDIVLGQRSVVSDKGSNNDVRSVVSGEDTHSADFKPVAVAGVDDLGIVVVESAVPGVAPHVLRNVPGSSHMFPWNKLLRRLSRRSLAVAAQYERTITANPSGAGTPATPQNAARRLYDTYKEYDTDVFSSRSPAALVVSPSLSHIPRVQQALAQQGASNEVRNQASRQGSKRGAPGTPLWSSTGVHLAGNQLLHPRTYFQTFGAPTTHLFPRATDPTMESLADGVYAKLNSGTIGRMSNRSMFFDRATITSGDETLDNIASSLAHQSRPLTSLELLALLATSPLVKYLTESDVCEALTSGILALFPQAVTAKMVGVAERKPAARASRVFRSPALPGSPQLEAVSVRSYSTEPHAPPRSSSAHVKVAKMTRDMSGLSLENEARHGLPAGSLPKKSFFHSELTSLPQPTDNAAVFNAIRGAVRKSTIGEDEQTPAPAHAPASEADPVRKKHPAIESGFVGKLRATSSQPAVSSPLRHTLPAPAEHMTPLPLGDSAVASKSELDTDTGTTTIANRSESLGNVPMADIIAERALWAGLLGVASSAAVLSNTNTASSVGSAHAGAPINPFQRRRGDMILATANRRRWWHMFPSEQLAEQQFTTPSANSAEVVQLTNKPPTGRSRPLAQDIATKSIGKNTPLPASIMAAALHADSPPPTSDGTPAVGDRSLVQDANKIEALASILPSFQPNWKSLCEPAIMPLTTDFMPGSQDLQAHFTETVYSVLLPKSLPGNVNLAETVSVLLDEHSNTSAGAVDDGTASSPATELSSPKAGIVSIRALHAAIVDEMICQRLTQDYQIVLDGNADDPRQDGEQGVARTYCLSMGHKIHKIIFDAAHGSIEVKMYTKAPAAAGSIHLHHKKLPSLRQALTSAKCSMYSAAHGLNSLPPRVPSDTNLAAEVKDSPLSPGGPEEFGFFVDTSATEGGSLSPIYATDAQAKSVHVKKDALLHHIAEARLLATLAKVLAPPHLWEDGVFDYKYLLWCPYRSKTVVARREIRAPAVAAMQQLAGTAVDATLVHRAFPSSKAPLYTPSTNTAPKSILASVFSRPTISDDARSRTQSSNAESGTSPNVSYLHTSTSMTQWPASKAVTPSAAASVGQLGHGAAPAAFGNRPVSVRAAPVVPQSIARPLIGPDRLLQDDYNWNNLDCLLTGEEESMNDSIRYRRVNLLVLPAPTAGKAESITAKDAVTRCVAFEKFWAQSQIHSKPPEGSSDGSKPAGRRKVHDYEPVKVHIPILGLDMSAVASADHVRPRVESIASSVVSEQRSQHVAPRPAVCKVLPLCMYDDSKTTCVYRVELRARGNAPFEWVHVQYGAIYNPMRAFPISIRWVTASTTAVESFVSGLQRRAKQHGFVVVPVPEYARKALVLRTDTYAGVGDQGPAGVKGGEKELPPFLHAVPLPISARIAHEVHHVRQNAPNHPPSSETVEPAVKPSSATASSTEPRLLGEPADDSTSVSATPLMRARSVSGTPYMSPLAKPPATDAAEVAKIDLGAPLLPREPVLLFGVSHSNTSLLLTFETALVQRFGFLPDFASGGAVSTSSSIKAWYSEQCSSGGLAAVVLSSFEGNRDRTLSVTSGTSSTAAGHGSGTLSAFAHLPAPQVVLHPCEAQTGWLRQYVHASAAAFVRVHANGVHWLPNKLQLGRLQQGAAIALAPWAAEGEGSESIEDPDNTNAAKINLYRAIKAFCEELLTATMS